MTGGRPQRWVVVCEEELFPVTTGCRVDHVGFLRAVTAAGIDLDVVVPLPKDASIEGYAAELPQARLFVAPRREQPLLQALPAPYVVASRPVPAGLADSIRSSGGPGPVTGVVSYSVRSAEIGRSLAREFAVRHVVRCQNHDSAYFSSLRSGASPARSLAYALEAVKLRRYETALERDSAIAGFFDVSAEEAAAHRLRTVTPVFHVPSFALSVEGTGDPAGARSGVVFVGSLDVETNIEAVRWLTAEVWPRVLASHPDAQLTVVGRRPTEATRAQVEAVGATLAEDVPAVEPYLHTAAVVVNPVRTGAGINVKLLQGVAAGAAAVTTSVGASGLAWQHHRELLVADAPEDFAAAIGELLADPARRVALSSAGQAFVRERLDPQRGVATFAACLAGMPGSADVPEPNAA